MKSPPKSVPVIIAMFVPALTSPFPATSSSSLRCCGSMLNFSGPKKVDFVLTRKSDRTSSQRFSAMSAAAAPHMISTSEPLILRISADFSNLSASRPASDEKGMYGSMYIPETAVISIPESSPCSSARRKVTSVTSAFLKRLSLKALANCVMKSGRKRRVFKRESCVIKFFTVCRRRRAKCRACARSSPSCPGPSQGRRL